MKTINLDQTKNTKMVYTGDVMAMYSPQIVRLYYDRNCDIQLTVNNSNLGVLMEERRTPVKSSANIYFTEFEISRMLQICSDLDAVLGRINYDGGAVSTSERISLALYEGDSGEEIVKTSVEVLYAACDAMERISNDRESVRLFLNYPQTINVGVNADSNIVVNGGSDNWEIPTTGQKKAGYELDWYAFMTEKGDEEVDDVNNGISAGDWCTYPVHIEGTNGELRYEEGKTYIFIPDKAEKGVYLRWLNRNGSVGYWLFKKSKKVFGAESANSFNSNLGGMDATPMNGVYKNKAKGDFSIGEALTLGTKGVTDEEYDFLCGLVCSPVVDMLVGGSRSDPEWMRVNVASGSYTREYPMSGLGRLRDFELIVTLPEKNTIKW